jgi:lysozyme family protein
MKPPTSYEDVIAEVFETEGGYVNSKTDRGGATNLGLTIGTMKALKMDLDGDGDVDIYDVKILTKEDAMPAYYDEFWVRGRVDRCPPLLRYLHFDSCVHHSPYRAIKILQKAYNHMRTTNRIKVDGRFGSRTEKAVSKLKLNVLIYYRIKYICDIVRNDSSQDANFTGWMNRITSFLKYI